MPALFEAFSQPDDGQNVTSCSAADQQSTHDLASTATSEWETYFNAVKSSTSDCMKIASTRLLASCDTNMTNPFEDPKNEFTVLVNGEGQHSLWPTFREAPPGWTAVCPPGTRNACLEYVEQHWTDIRPRKLIEQADSRD